MRTLYWHLYVDFCNNILSPLQDKVWTSKHYQVKCFICGEILDSKKIPWAPRNCGWHQLADNHHRWICHRCADHRHFSKKYIEMIDEEDRKRWENEILYYK